ncbi:UDP-N-acetylmuramoyl-L-alanyl-D-glutamate--2,6-diaminopimelate ligase [Roseivirga sp. BDSF3-8]|uniref:UDP-N-acetylmuramoyl-L-alanyl-D-glutamate--2, 6-diaminopimelate ligase n=1 Tax=Roseivirga sp. BDSF3-8 TaxID=3241598 RepID=UPI0035326975
MMALKDIVYRVSLKSVSGDMNDSVTGITFDSRAVNKGDLFVAVRGTATDGHLYIDKALEKGASAIVCEELPADLKEGVTWIEVENSAKALGLIASNYYNNPSSRLSIIGVTGTNGKTTTVSLLFRLFSKLGYKCGLLSTVVNRIGTEEVKATHTTPDALQLNELLDRMAKEGCTHVFMEASSHALVQERMAGLAFRGAVFSNISHDHLDYHGTFEEYIKAKKKLFDELPKGAFALVNADDRRANVMLQNTKASKKSFSLKSMSDYKARVLSNTLEGLELDIDNKVGWYRLIGDFNAYNLLAVYSVAVELGEDPEEVLTALSELKPAPGRFEHVPNKLGITAIVDYAHTPDALENVLATIKEVRTTNEQVITVVGCGGDRDKAKRPLMAEIACRFSDKVILTSDNPRTEDPERIIKDMQEGVSASNYRKAMSITNRREAIKAALGMAQAGDIVLVAGKGHETYQEIDGIRHDFDDKKVIADVLARLSSE